MNPLDSVDGLVDGGGRTVGLLMDLRDVSPEVMRVRGLEVTIIALLIFDLVVHGLNMHLEVKIISALIVTRKALVVVVVLVFGLFRTILNFFMHSLDVTPEVLTERGLEGALLTTLFPYRGVGGPDMSLQVVLSRGAVLALGARVLRYLLVHGPDVPLQRPPCRALIVTLLTTEPPEPLRFGLGDRRRAHS